MEIEPTLEKVEKRDYPEGYTTFYAIAFTHDFGGGYVGSDGKLILLEELRPKVHLLYESGTLRAWVTPRECFPGPVFIYINGKLARWGEEVEWNATFLAGEYNITAVYFDGEDVYMNQTVIISDLKPKLLWKKSLRVKNGTIIYGKINVPGAPVNISGRTVWTDSDGYFSFFVENRSYSSTETPEPKPSTFNWAVLLVVLGVTTGAGGIAFYMKKDKRGLVLLLIGLILIAGYFVVPKPREAVLEEKPLTLSIVVVMPPAFYGANITVLVDGEEIGRTDKRGRLNIPLDYGIHEVLLRSGNSTTSLMVAMAEDRNLTVPFFPGVNAILRNGPGYNSFSASFGEIVLNTMHANTYPLGPMSLKTYTTPEECELCKLKASMVGVVEGETCRLCCLESKNFGPAVVFAYYFHLIWDVIERYQCIIPWPPMPETNAVVTGASINSYASDIWNSLPQPGWGDLHPCLAPLDGIDPKDPANICTILECADVNFDCNCYMTCFTGPFKVWDAFVKCLENKE